MKDFNGNEIRVGDRVEKARRYNLTIYCRYGGEDSVVPLFTRGEVTRIEIDNVWVKFDNGTTWNTDSSELNRVYSEKDFDTKFVLDSVGNKIRKGDIVERINCKHWNIKVGDIFEIAKIEEYGDCPVIDDNGHFHEAINLKLVKANTIVKEQVVEKPNIIKTEGTKMELKDMKKDNIKEAKKKFQEETTNAEIEEAKRVLRNATDMILLYDREIKAIEEKKKPFLEILEHFK